MSRAAAFALVATVVGCHSDPAATTIIPEPVAKPAPKPEPKPEPAPPPDSGLVDDQGGSAAEYGAPPHPKPPKPSPIAVPAYGGPPPIAPPKPGP